MLTLEELATERTGVSVREVDEESVKLNVDRLARQVLGISGEEFLATYPEGVVDLPDSPRARRLISTAKLLS